MSKLTVKELEALRPKDAGTRLREDGGLIGNVKQSSSGRNGVVVYFDWRFRSVGKVRQLALGTWPKKTLAEIRDALLHARTLVAAGHDPTEQRKAERLKAKVEQAEAVAAEQARLCAFAARRARITVSDLFERWAETDLVRRKDGGAEVRRMFAKDVLPILGGLAVEDVKKGHITAVTDTLLARKVNRMAKLIFALVRQMFRFAVDRDIIDTDPTSSIRKAKIGGKDVERDRVLSEDEIRELGAKMCDARLMRSTECAVWIALSTCCRIGELLNARWEHLDLERGKWRIPSPNAKNHRAHIVQLSSFALEQFERLREVNGQGAWCYPNRDGSAAVSVKTVTKQIGDRQRSLAPMSGRSKRVDTLSLPGGHWVPHDLRRTGATMMTMLGVLPEVADRCLNHTEENKIRRTYLRHTYETEMNRAWMLLGDRLSLLLQSHAGNVVTFSRHA